METQAVQISIFGDEISRDFPKRAIELAREWSITHLEVRMFPGGRFPAVPDAQLETFSRHLREAGLTVSGVSPGFFKCPWDDPSVSHALSERLPRACEWAQRWGSDLVTCFACQRDNSPNVPHAVIDLLGQMASTVQHHGCRLALENESTCWGATGVEAADIIRQIGSGGISLCWDPSNSSMAGSVKPYPDEYEDLKDLVSHVHMKNVDPIRRSWCLINEGAIDWPGQLDALSDDGYDGFLVIETHLHVSPDEFLFVDGQLSRQESDTLRNLRFVRSCLGKRA